MPRLYNLLGATPLIVWYIWGLSRETPIFIQRFSVLEVSGYINAPLALQALAQAASIAFVSFLIVLLIVRDVPRTRTRAFAPYVAAMVGTLATTSSFFLPVAAHTALLFAVATLLITLGFGLSIYALIYLGRSFAILPSARTLVIDGPYRFVRHPLYLFEEIAVVGIMIQFVQPWSMLLMLAHFAAQLARMHYEEQVLTQVFPEYAAYAARTKRLIPGIY